MFKGIGNALVGLVNSSLSLVKDKTHNPDDSYIHEKIKNGISISTKRVLNLGATTAIVGFAITWLLAGKDTTVGLVALGIGAAYSAFMSWMTQKAEAKKTNGGQ